MVLEFHSELEIERYLAAFLALHTQSPHGPGPGERATTGAVEVYFAPAFLAGIRKLILPPEVQERPQWDVTTPPYVNGTKLIDEVDSTYRSGRMGVFQETGQKVEFCKLKIVEIE